MESNNTSPANNAGQSVMKTGTMDPIILHTTNIANQKWLHSTTNFLANHFTLMQNYILQLAVLNKLCGFYTFSEYYRTVINTHWFYK